VFGAVRATSGTATTEYRFTDQQDDATLGLTYLRARYYDPSTGRFLTKDSWRGAVAAPQSQNRYVYALNSPTVATDPSGRVAIVLGACAANPVFCAAAVGFTATLVTAGIEAVIAWHDEQAPPDRIYRGGGPSPSNLRPRPGEEALSARNSASNPWPLPEGERPVLRPGEDYIVIDPQKLPEGSVEVDNEPAGHVSIRGVDAETLRGAIVDRGKWPKTFPEGWEGPNEVTP
jgi:RHS repeat-associated protein